MTTYESVLLVMLLSYGVLAVSVSQVINTGQLTLCAGFWFGSGAYTTAYLAKYFGGELFIIPLGIAVILIALMNGLLFLPARKFRGDGFALYTLAIQLLFNSILINAWDLTGGEIGISGIPKAPFFGLTIVAIICYLFFIIMIRSKLYKILTAVGDNEAAALSLGLSVGWIRFATNVAASAIGGLGGGILALAIGHVDPTMCSIDMSILMLVAICVGGVGTWRGILAGTLFLVVLPEFTRIARHQFGALPELSSIVVGIVLLAIVVLQPFGLLPRETRKNERYS